MMNKVKGCSLIRKEEEPETEKNEMEFIDGII